MPRRPTIWMIVGQGPIAFSVGAGGGCLDILLSSIFSLLFLPLLETEILSQRAAIPKTTNQKNQNKVSISTVKYKQFTHCPPIILILIQKDENHKGALRKFCSLMYRTRDFLLISGSKKFSKKSPKIKTFWNVLLSSTIFHWKLLLHWRKFRIILFYFQIVPLSTVLI